MTAETKVWDLAKPEEIISKLPPDWHDKLDSKKWQERKEVLESLQIIVVSAIRLKPGDYNEFCDALINVVRKDVNIVVVQLAVKVITSLADGLRAGFAPYAHPCLEVLLERSREKKPNLIQTFREAFDAIFASTNLEAMAEVVVPFLSNKTPTVRVETAAFLERCFCSSRGPGLFGQKKILTLYVGPLLSLVGDQTGEVREAAFETLGCLHAFAGEKAVEPLLSDVDQIRLSKIHEVSQRWLAVASPPLPSSPTPPPVVKSPPPEMARSRKLSLKEATGVDISKEEAFITRTDVRGKLTDELLEQLDDPVSYKVRKEAIDKVLEIIQEAKLIQPKIGNLPAILAKRLKEASKVLVQSALTVCEQLAVSIGKKITEHIGVLVPAILVNFGDNKPQIRQQAITCMGVWVDQCGGSLAPFLDNNLFSNTLQTGNPTLRGELFSWLSKRLPANQCRLPKDDLIASIPFLLSALEDRSGDVRKAGQDALMPFMIHTGSDPFDRALEFMKQASKDQLVPIIDKAKQKLQPLVTIVSQTPKMSRPTTATLSPKPVIVKPVTRVPSSHNVRPVIAVRMQRSETMPPNIISSTFNYSPVAPVAKPSTPKPAVLTTNKTSSLIPRPTPIAKSLKTALISPSGTSTVAKSCRSIEVKAKLNEEINVDRLVKQACSLARCFVKPGAIVSVTISEQRDTFFNSILPGNRLKLRQEICNSQTKKAHMVGYNRHDQDWPIECSDYVISHIDYSEAEQLTTILKQSFGVRGQTMKTRTTILIGQTRVHVDQVQGLGNFLKIEVVKGDNQTAEDGLKVAEDIMRSLLNVSNSNIVAPQYLELLTEKAQRS